MSKTILVTGVNGFVGKHLARELKNRGDEVIGIGREASPAPEIKELLTDYWACDLMDKGAVAKLSLEGIDGIISLAGLARVGDSFANPEKYNQVNVGVLANLCQVLVDRKLRPRIIAISTAYVYEPRQTLPITEQSELINDGSPYAKSKLAMEKAVKAFRDQGLEIVIVRPFNHIGPGQEEGFLVPDLFAKLRSAKEIIKVGNLANRRDYTDVRDVVRAYVDLTHAESLDYDLYVVASGKSVPGQQVLKLLLDNMGLTGKIRAVVDQKLLRPNDFADLCGSYERLNRQTGWQPQISLQKTLEDFVKSSSS